MTKRERPPNPFQNARALRDAYIKQVNAALEGDREDLAEELAADYDAERTRFTAPAAFTAPTSRAA